MQQFSLQEFNEIFLDVVDIKLNRNGYRFLTRFAHGECMFYAYTVKSVLGGVAYSFLNNSYSGHCFIKINKRYYDSENPNGVLNWKNLQSFTKRTRKNKPTKRHISPTKILVFWGCLDDKPLWDEIISEISLRLEKNLYL